MGSYSNISGKNKLVVLATYLAAIASSVVVLPDRLPPVFSNHNIIVVVGRLERDCCKTNNGSSATITIILTIKANQ